MKPLVYKYENPDKQTVHFRGYTKQYSGAKAIVTTCKEVRTNQAEALRDAKKLIKSLSTIV
jgi:hypothetical protein